MMKKRYKTYTQEDFGKLLKIEQSQVSRLLNGKEKIGFPLAVRLSQLFPGKDILGWKNANKEGLNRLYNQLKLEAKETA